MASTTKIIDPDNGAGTDYTSLAAWEAWASTQGTSGDTHTAQCRSSSGTADTSVSIYAWVSGVEYRIEVLSGYRHNAIPGGTNVYKLQVADYGYGITITSISGTVDGVEIISGGTQSRQPIRVSYGGTQIFENMLVQGAGANYASFQSTYGTGYRTVRNCIFYARNASATCIEGASSSTSTIAVENCTIVGYMNGVLELSGTVTCSNVGVSGATTAFGSGVATTTCSSTTPSFVDAAIDDYHLDVADTAWRGAGTDLSATFTTDIDGDTRSSWDIGADEYVSGGGGTAYFQSLAGAFPAGSASIVKKISVGRAGSFPAGSASIVKKISVGRAGSFPAGSGVASSGGRYSAAVSGSFPAPTGSLAKKIRKGVAGVFGAMAGALRKKTAVTRAGEFPSASGTTSTSYQTSEATSGIFGAMSGAVSTVLNPVVAIRAAIGLIGSRFRRIIGG